MTADDAARAGQLFADVLAQTRERSEALDLTYQQLENAGLIGRVVVQRYLCRRGCTRATAIRVGGLLIARTRDYKMAPAANVARSVEAARKKRTLDGDRHWPGHTYDVTEMADWGEGVGIDASCRHAIGVLQPLDIVRACEKAVPGHPGKPHLD